MRKTYQICSERDLRVVIQGYPIYDIYDCQLEMNGFGVVAQARMETPSATEAIATFLYVLTADLPEGLNNVYPNSVQHLTMRMRYSMEQWIANHVNILPRDFLTGLYRNWYVT